MRKTSYINMSRYPQGAVVRHIDTHDMGHVIGFDRKYDEDGSFETVITVLWEDGVARSNHPSDLEIF